MELEKLGQYKEYGESVLQGLEATNQPLPDWVPLDLRQSLESLRQAATKTVELASSPVKIGVMGEFSSGKTLLLGSLLGYADALPVSETPTTGNVTAVHLIQQDSLETTKVDQFEIKYLSHSEVGECLKFMLSEMAQRAKTAQLAPAQVEALKSLTPTQAIDSNAILRWCEQAWNESQNKGLRSLLRELVIFVRTYSVLGKDLCSREYQVDGATAKEGLKLADPPVDILKQSFSELPAVGKPWQNLERPSAQDLLESFSLIRLVDVTVTVSKQIWDLEALEGTQEFVLLDFPGLGAAESGVRDKFLSLRELKEVQTILLLANGRKPGGETADAIRNMMEQDKGVDLRDRILVGVGRFNQLPLSGKDEETIDRLIGFSEDDRTLLSEAEVLQELPILNLTVAGARNLTTEEERIVLLSQMWALQELAERSTTLQVSSPEFAPNLEKYLGKNDEERLRQKWQQLSERLQETGQTKILRRQLRDLVDDGGIGRLRSLIIDHVQEYGLRQLYEDTERQAEKLRQAQLALKEILKIIPDYMPPNEKERKALLTLRQSIENLLNSYRKFARELEKKPLQDAQGKAVSEAVKEELIFDIHNWNEWNLLFNKMAEGTIAVPRPDERPGRGVIGRNRAPRQRTPLATKSDDFYETFAKTMERMEGFADDRIRQALREMLNQLSAQVEPDRHKLSQILRPEMEGQISAEFGEYEADLFNMLQEATDPNQWTDAIIEESAIADNSTIEANLLFPLAREDEKHEKGQVFDWSPEKKHPTPPIPFNHQILVLRLRDEISASAGLNMVQYVSEKTERVKSVLLSTLEVTNDMSELLQNQNLLMYIASVEEGKKETPPWLQTLSQIVEISYPD